MLHRPQHGIFYIMFSPGLDLQLQTSFQSMTDSDNFHYIIKV